MLDSCAAPTAAGRLRRALLPIAALIAFWVAPPAASAGTVSVFSQHLSYAEPYDTGSPDEQNDVTISFDPAAGTSGVYTVTDAGSSTILDGDLEGGCSVSGNVATCPVGPPVRPLPGGEPYPKLTVSLAEGNDRLVVLSALADVVADARGGNGADVLDLSRVSTSALAESQIWGDDPGVPGMDLVGGGLAGDGDDVVYAGDYVSAPAQPAVQHFSIIGGGGADRLYGGPARDSIVDGYPIEGTRPVLEDVIGEADLLDGRGGDDTLFSGEGADALFGGAGDDRVGTFSWDDGAVDANSCGPGEDSTLLFPGDAVDPTCEQAYQSVTCPEGASGTCTDTVIASAPPPPAARVSGPSSSWLGLLLLSADGLRARPPRIRLAPPIEVKVRRGARKRVLIEFQRKQLGKALLGRTSVRSRIAVRRRTDRRPLSTKQTPFVLKRAR